MGSTTLEYLSWRHVIPSTLEPNPNLGFRGCYQRSTVGGVAKIFFATHACCWSILPWFLGPFDSRTYLVLLKLFVVYQDGPLVGIISDSWGDFDESVLDPRETGSLLRIGSGRSPWGLSRNVKRSIPISTLISRHLLRNWPLMTR